MPHNNYSGVTVTHTIDYSDTGVMLTLAEAGEYARKRLHIPKTRYDANDAQAVDDIISDCKSITRIPHFTGRVIPFDVRNGTAVQNSADAKVVKDETLYFIPDYGNDPTTLLKRQLFRNVEDINDAMSREHTPFLPKDFDYCSRWRRFDGSYQSAERVFYI